MLKLIKFEMKRKKTLFQAALFIVVVTQLLISMRFFAVDASFRVNHNENLILLYLVIVFIVFAILYFIDLVTLFRNDVFHPEGYMLFMTPNSGYKILASKLMFALIEGLSIFLIYFVLLLINMRMLYGSVFFQDLRQINMDWNIMPLVGRFGLSVITSLVEFALTVYLSYAIFKSLFPNLRFKGLLTLIIFFVISVFKGRIVAYISAFEMKRTYYAFLDEEMITQVIGVIREALNVSIGFNIVSAVITFLITGYLLEKKVNL